MGFPYEQAVMLELLERRDEALAIYERIGDLRDAKRLRATLIGTNRCGRVRNELTEREREIAKLVSTGKSNRAIAAALVISERTVENHLASIFGKLGVSSRTELATKMVTTLSP
jgi:DNA-binding NarL/FixJ family response regulator